MTANFLAIDIGASSGRVMLGRWDGERFDLVELHRFPNEPVQVGAHLYWDVLRLWHETKIGMARYASQYSEPLAAIGVDTWAVDFALLDDRGMLLGNPRHYRDRRTEGMPEQVDRLVSPPQLYALTGIQRLSINTIYQLYSMRQGHDIQLDTVGTFLLIPDLFHYWMMGEAVAEYTNATTTQLYSVHEGRWATDLLDTLGIPTRIFPPVVAPGTRLGELLPEVGAEVGFQYPVPVIASASHDTASAVAAIPDLDSKSLFISSGTWSLAGVEVARPILSEQARELNFTNEGGVGGTIRFLKNIGGLWLLQECQRHWQREGHTYTWPALVALAQQVPPLKSVVDPDAPLFLHPLDMRLAIQEYCECTGQEVPAGVGEIVRCCLESLALKYRWALSALEGITGSPIDTIRVVGGGSQNALLCQLTADACDRDVVAGPSEATALGNILVQAVATGHITDIAAGRRAVAISIEQVTYRCSGDDTGAWNAAYNRLYEQNETGDK